MRNHLYENVFRLQVHFHANQTHFHMKGFTRGLVLKQRHKVTRKWPIPLYEMLMHIFLCSRDLVKYARRPGLVIIY